MSYTVTRYFDSAGYTKSSSNRTYNIKYIVESSTENDMDIHAAGNASTVPQLGAVYDYDSGVFVKTVTLDSHKFADDKTIFIFNVQYESGSSSSSDFGSANPLNDPPKITVGTAKYSVPFELAYQDGDAQASPSKPVLNSASQKFDPPMAIEQVNTVVTVQYNVRTFKGDWIQKFVNTLNSSSMTVVGITIPPCQGRINEIGASNNYDSNGNQYWTVSVAIEISGKSFRKSVLDQGAMALNAKSQLDIIYVETDDEGNATKKLKSDIENLKQKLKDGKAEIAPEPSLLNQAGGLLAQGADPKYISYRAFYETSWNSLNLPKKLTSSTNSLGGAADL